MQATPQRRLAGRVTARTPSPLLSPRSRRPQMPDGRPETIERVAVSIAVNGRTYRRTVEPRLLLSDFIRHELGLTGTHVGCEHGVCGACTVLVDAEPARACLM